MNHQLSPASLDAPCLASPAALFRALLFRLLSLHFQSLLGLRGRLALPEAFPLVPLEVSPLALPSAVPRFPALRALRKYHIVPF
jgi:hypothetical protein